MGVFIVCGCFRVCRLNVCVCVCVCVCVGVFVCVVGWVLAAFGVFFVCISVFRTEYRLLIIHI